MLRIRAVTVECGRGFSGFKVSGLVEGAHTRKGLVGVVRAPQHCFEANQRVNAVVPVRYRHDHVIVFLRCAHS